MTDLSECTICYQTANRDFRKITSKCTHQAVVCTECVIKHVQIQLDEKQELKIPCPTRECEKIMERYDVKNIVTEELFKRYDTLAFKTAIQNIPEFRWCKDPCGAGQIHIGEGKAPIVKCENCGSESCYIHKVAWHTGKTCREYDEGMRQSDLATENYISQNAKKCPGCTAPITKDGGCDHMTCKCLYQFCWLCLHKHPGHKSHCNKFRSLNFLCAALNAAQDQQDHI